MLHQVEPVLMLCIRSMVKVWILLLSIFITQNAGALIIGTYNAPPFSMYEDNVQIGMITEVVQDLLAKAKITEFTTTNYTLARGLVELHQGRIDVFYPYTSSGVAQSHGTMIGPIGVDRIALFVRADNNNSVGLEHIIQETIATERGGTAEHLLQGNNYKLELTTNKTSCLTMVLGNRVPYCAVGTLPGMYLAALNNMYAKLHFIDTQLYSDMYLLLSPKIAPEVAAAIQEAYTELKAERYFEKKQQAYEAKFKIFIDSMK